MEQNRFISAQEAIEKEYCIEQIEGKLKWLLEKDTGKKLISCAIDGEYTDSLYVTFDGKIIGWGQKNTTLKN